MTIYIGSLVSVVVVLIVVGFLLWLVNTKLPIEPTVRAIINFVVVLAVVLWLLEAFGVLRVSHYRSSGSPTHQAYVQTS